MQSIAFRQLPLSVRLMTAAAMVLTWVFIEEKIIEPFNRGYMNRLYQAGRSEMLSGKAWSKYPPGYNPVPLSRIKTAYPG